MNNLSPLPAAVSEPRLSYPEAVAPNASNPALQARRQKLRRLVAGVVSGATLLICAGLVRAAIRAHSEPESTPSSNTTALLATAPSVSVTPTAPDFAAVQPAAAPAPNPSAVAGAKKAGAHARSAKPAKRSTLAKGARH